MVVMLFWQCKKHNHTVSVRNVGFDYKCPQCEEEAKALKEEVKV